MDNEVQIKRMMPNSIEAEQAVIGAMLMDRDAIITAMKKLNKEDFYYEVYATLFEAMKELFDADQAVDTITLQNRLREKNAPPEISSLEYIGSILNAIPTSANVCYFANIVRDKAVLRNLIRTLETLENECYAEEEPVPLVLEDTEKKISKIIQESRRNTDYEVIRDIMLNALIKIGTVS